MPQMSDEKTKATDAFPGIVVDKTLSLDKILSNDRVVILGRSTCPFCTEVDRALSDRFKGGDRKHVYYRLDQLSNGKALHQELKEKTKQTSVPYVFVNGHLVGGCTDVYAGGYDGKLSGVLGVLPESMAAADAKAPNTVQGALFLFPNTVDSRVVTTTGAVVSITSLVIAILGIFDSTYDAAKWMALGLLVDFILRFFAGANASVLGAFAAMLVGAEERFFGTRAQFRAGVPKQFAQFIGVIFSALGAIFLLADAGTWARWVAFAFLAGLAGAAGLEGFMKFCLGCVFFGFGVQFGIFPTSLYSAYVDELADTQYMWKDVNKPRANFSAPEGNKKDHPTRTTASKVDLRWKEKTDDMRREEHNFVRYFHAGYWAASLSLVALAFVFNLSSVIARDRAKFGLRTRDMPSEVWQVLAVLAVAAWAVSFFLHTGRFVLFTRKVYKEWTCPTRSNAYVFPTICLLVFVHFAADKDGANSQDLAKALFWIAAPLQLLICIRILSQWIYYLRHDDHISVLWLAVPLSNVFAATAYTVGYPSSKSVSGSAAQLWMGFAVLLFVALYPTALHRAIMGHNQVMEDRAMHWLLAAAPAVLAIGWQSLYGSVELTTVFVSLYFGALVMLACLLYGIFPMRFHCRGRFHMGLWAVGFTASALALCAILFDASVMTRASNVVRIILIVGACIANWICFMHFMRDVFTRKVFTADKMAAPLLFFKLSHEAARGLMAKMQVAMDTANVQKFESATGLVRLWDDYEFFTRVHMLHEDDVIFKKADEWLPHHSDPFAEEHEKDKEITGELVPLFAQLKAACHASPSGIASPQLLSLMDVLTPKLTAALEFFEAHLTHEENRLSPCLRKNMNIPMMQATVQEIWEVTDTVDMFRFLPLVVTSIRKHPERVMFIRMLLWAMPQRAAQIGTILALGVGQLMWQRLSEEVPDINPRGMAGWHRY